MKDGAILANSGHFDVEIDKAALAALSELLGIIEDTVRDLAADGRWRVHHVGHAGPAAHRHPVGPQGGRAGHPDNDGVLVNVAIGYGGRQEIADAVRSLLLDARREGHLVRGARRDRRHRHDRRHLYTAASPIRTW